MFLTTVFITMNDRSSLTYKIRIETLSEVETYESIGELKKPQEYDSVFPVAKTLVELTKKK